jgi:trigger factor
VQVKVTSGGKWHRLIDVHLAPEELAPHFEKTLREYQKRVSIQGFRKGKVPLPMLRKLYGGSIQEETIKEMLPDIMEQVREREGLKPVSQVKIEDYKFEPESGLRFRASLDVEPEVELRKYRGFELEKKVYEIGDEDVAEELQHICEHQARFEDFVGTARYGDYVHADLQEVDVAGLPVIGNKQVDRLIVLAKDDQNGSDAEGFSAQLVGAKSGETRTVKVIETPDSMTAPPTPTYYQVTIKGVKEKILPTLDDAFAKTLGNYENLDQLREAVRRRLEIEVSARANQDLKNQLMDLLVKENSPELPESMIEYNLDLIIEELKKKKAQDFDEKPIREEYRASAIWGLKWRLLKEKLIAQEGLALDADEAEKYVTQVAAVRRKNPQREWSQIKNKPEELARLQQDLLEEKLLERLLKQQKISEKKIMRQNSQASRLIV